MRREVLASAIRRIVDDLNRCDIKGVIQFVLDNLRRSKEQKDTGISIPLSVFKRYAIATSSYSDIELQVYRILGIAELLETEFWQKLSDLSDPDLTLMMRHNVDFTLEQLPKFLALIEQEHVDNIKNQSAELPEELKGKELLSILVIEDQNQFSSPSRLIYVLEAITNLYTVFATLEGGSESDLIVIACDSGSDKSFDFLGMAKFMEQIKEIIIQIWDRRVFHRQRHVSECIGLIAESLPIIKEIEELKKNKTLGPEQAELLKRKVIDGTTKFIQSGATIKEMESESKHTPRQLMRPEPKLLVSPWSEDDEGHSNRARNEIKEANADAFSDEELNRLESLVKKAKRSKPTRKITSRKKKST